MGTSATVDRKGWYNPGLQTAEVLWPSDSGTFQIELKEKTLKITCNNNLNSDWFLDLNIAQSAQTPIKSITSESVIYEFDGHTYKLSASKGVFEKPRKGAAYRLRPKGQTILLSMNEQ